MPRPHGPGAVDAAHAPARSTSRRGATMSEKFREALAKLRAGRPDTPVLAKPAGWDTSMPSRGLGDTVAKFTHATGIDKAAKLYAKVTGKPCGCAGRQAVLNRKVPYSQAPRIGLVTPSLYPGGAEQWMLQLIRTTSGKIDWSGVACIDQQWAVQDVVDEFSKIISVHGFDHAATNCILDSDCIIVWGPNIPAVLHEYQGKLVFVCHGDERSKWVKLAIDDLNKIPAVRFVAVSDESARSFVGVVPAGQVEVIPNGIDQDRCESKLWHEEAKVRLGYSADDFLVGFIGRIGAEKRPKTLLRAMTLLPPRFKLLMVGEGLVKKEMETHAERHLPGKVKFLPGTREIGDILRAFDCAATASSSEGFGLSSVEALSAGVPLVSASVGILLQIARTHGVCWEAIERDSQPVEMAAAIRRVANMDAFELQRRVAIAKKAVAADYTLEAFGKRWTQYLLHLTKGN